MISDNMAKDSIACLALLIRVLGVRRLYPPLRLGVPVHSLRDLNPPLQCYWLPADLVGTRPRLWQSMHHDPACFSGASASRTAAAAPLPAPAVGTSPTAHCRQVSTSGSLLCCCRVYPVRDPSVQALAPPIIHTRANFTLSIKYLWMKK